MPCQEPEAPVCDAFQPMGAVADGWQIRIAGGPPQDYSVRWVGGTVEVEPPVSMTSYQLRGVNGEGPGGWSHPVPEPSYDILMLSGVLVVLLLLLWGKR